MTKTEQRQSVIGMLLKHYVDPWRGSVADWCVANVVFDEPGNRGPFSLAGREYIREPLNDWGDGELSDCVEVMGSQTGKTAKLMAGAAWSVVNDPSGIIWCMPSINLAQSFSETRWQTMLRATATTADMIPDGAARHAFKNLEQRIGGSLVNFVGSNSPSNLASRPARKLVLDEVDKFDEGSDKEADAVNLLEQRTKAQPYPKRFKTSTPTIVEGLIWQEYLKGDQRRYFVPCPHCGNEILLVWSANFTALPKQGCESYVKWDQDAKIDGKWDLDRVAATAHVECCHCGGSITDSDKPGMVAAGVWRPTAKAVLGFRSRQLSSLYACSPETTFGKLAVKFLQATTSLTGVQGFINGDLAEPYVGQDQSQRRTERIEAVSTDGWRKILTVDYQQTEPFIWFVARAWNGGNSVGIEAGSLFQFEELRAVQERLGIADIDVFVDSGYNPSQVYAECLIYGQQVTDGRQDKLPLHFGWTPTRGVDGEKDFYDRAEKTRRKWMLEERDPHAGKSGSGQVVIERLLFASDFYKDVLASLRKGKGEYTWSVPESMATQVYWKHLDGERKVQQGRRWIWQPRHRYWPNHLLDCEVQQVAVANFLQLYMLDLEQSDSKRD